MTPYDDIRKNARAEDFDSEVVVAAFVNEADREKFKGELSEFLVNRSMGVFWYPDLNLPTKKDGKAVVNDNGNCDIFIPDLNLAQLRKQREWLFKFGGIDEAEGLINLIDHMLDTAEGV